MLIEQLPYLIALSKISLIGSKKARLLISYCGGAKPIFKKSKTQLLKIPGIGPKLAEAVLRADPMTLSQMEMKFLSDHPEIRVIPFNDNDFPNRLKQNEDAPLFLYYRGNTDLNNTRTVAIVGTRTPTNYGKLFSDALVKGLKKYNCTIISGLAYGIDSEVHRACIKYDIPTIGVLGHGLDKIYPHENTALAKKMVSMGGLLTEFPPLTIPLRENFPKRNRIIAAMSDAVIVVESKRKGGSIITALLANEYNKDVFALPGKIKDEYSIGCNWLIKTHQAAMLESSDDIGYIMMWDQTAEEPSQKSLFIDLNDDEQKVCAILDTQVETSFDTIHYQHNKSVSELSSILLNLEFKGILKTLPGKRYILA